MSSKVVAIQLVFSATKCIAIESESASISSSVNINKQVYQDRLRGFWLGSCIANWTGLPAENARTTMPFFTDADWQTASGHNGTVLDYELNADPWGADDDTDIEYIYQHAMEKYNQPVLTPGQISHEWQRHIGLPLLWVSNLAAANSRYDGWRSRRDNGYRIKCDDGEGLKSIDMLSVIE